MIFTLKSLVSSLLAITVLVTVPVRASQKDKQADQQKELEKKTLALLSDVTAAAWSLKLPENRLFILSNAADLLWTVDEKRARTLYWDALNALNLVAGPVRSSGQKLSLEERTKLVQNYISEFELRQRLLLRVAKRDAQLALDMLRGSRPVPPRHLMPEYTLPDDTQLEQGIAMEVAARDPAQALQIARQSLSKGLTFELFSLLQRLNDVDAEKGSQFAGEIIDKIRIADLATDIYAAIIAVQLLQHSRKSEQAGLKTGQGGMKLLKIDEDQKRNLVEVMINTLLDPTTAQHAAWQLSHIMPEIEHFFPERRQAVAAKFATFDRRLSQADRDQNDFTSVISSGSVEDVVRMTGTLDSATHTALYRHAAIMAVAEGKTDWFREVINKQTMSAEARAQIIDSLDFEEISVIVSRRQIEQLEKLVPKIRRQEERGRAMVGLALLLHEKGDKVAAAAMLDEAASMIKTDLNDEKQTNALLTLLCAFAVVDPPKAFALAERTIDRANRQISLLLLVDKVVKSGAVKKNEVLLEQPQLMPIETLVFKYGDGVAALARADFNRTKALAERFERNELKLMAQLFVLKGLLESQARGSTQAL